MNHTTKKIIVAAILSVLCLILISCGGVDSIYFDKEPRTTYVQGQDIVLDDATLIALKGDESTPVDVAEVVISGYDKNTLGAQEVTFSYKDQSVSLTVKVIPRISVEGAATSYFVGDTFDKTKGRLKVADDEGKTTTVNMSDAAVTIESFDSSSAGKGKSVTVKYGSYSGTFSVDVYTADTVELTSRPKKTSYYSHETTFSTTGAYFTVIAEGGAFSRMVELTEDMVEGFNPGAATIENLDTSMKQTVTISYLGNDYPFEISIRYSGVSLMQLRGEELKDVDPASATKEQGEAAIFAMEKYVNLSATEREEIDEKIVTNLLNIAVTYGASAFKSATDSFSETFEIRSDYDEENKRYVAGFNITATKYDAVVADLARLKNESEPFVTLAGSLREIKDEFYDTKIDDKTVDELLATIYEEDSFELVIDLFDLMIELHDILSVVPDDWTVETLPDYKDAIIAAVVRASSNDFGAFQGYDSIYVIVSSWREKNDYFDIIYSYYLEYDKDSLVDTLWQKVLLPGKLQALYKMISYALGATQSMKVGVDTTAFMYYYNEASELAKEIKEGDNQLHIDIYKHIGFDSLLNTYLFIGSANGVNGIAYVYHASSLLDNPTYDALLEKYLALLDASLYEDFSFASEESLALASEMLSLYMDFTPAERFAFLCALYCDYRYSITDELVLSHEITEDDEIAAYSYFVRLLLSVYRENLSAEAFDVLARLLEASEMYTLRNHNSKHYDGFTDSEGVVHKGFIETMEEILVAAKDLSEEEKASFAVALNKLTEIYNECKTPTTPELSDSAKDSFADLKDAIEVFFELYTYADSEEVASADKGRYFIIAFAAYERAKAIASEIMTGDDEAALHTYLYVPYTFDYYFEQEDGSTTIERTFDFMLDEMGGLFHLVMLNMEAITGPEDNPYTYNAFYVYYVSEMSIFLEDVYDTIIAEYRGTAAYLTVADVMESLAAYRELTEDQIFGMYLLSASPIYFEGVIHCLGNSLDESTMKVVMALMYAQERYAAYIAGLKDATAKQAFADSIDALKTAYTDLEDKSVFDQSFLEMYNFYIDTFNNLPEEDDTTEDEGGTTVTPAPDGDGNEPLD